MWRGYTVWGFASYSISHTNHSLECFKELNSSRDEKYKEKRKKFLAEIGNEMDGQCNIRYRETFPDAISCRGKGSYIKRRDCEKEQREG